jgi:hydroxymethylbilane synthase
MLPAAGQGALAVIARDDDAELIACVAQLDHADTRAAVTAEREVLAALGGGCHLPVGVSGRVAAGTLRLVARVVSVDGRRTVEHALSGPAHGAVALGRDVASRLAADGAEELLT